LKCATGLAFSLGIPDPIATLAGDFGSSQVFLVPSLAVSVDAFSSSVGAEFRERFELLSYNAIVGSAIELPCATAFELALASSGHIITAGHP
jgi:hypothetical protein